MIPLVGMQLSDEVVWTFFDFVFAGTFIFGIGLTYQLIARRGPTAHYRVATGLPLVATFLLVWVDGAVGIIGSEDNPANLLYGGVLAILFFGSVIADLKPKGMSRVLYTTALAHILVPVIAFIFWRPDFGLGVVYVFILNAIFSLLWIASGIYYGRAHKHV